MTNNHHHHREKPPSVCRLHSGSQAVGPPLRPGLTLTHSPALTHGDTFRPKTAPLIPVSFEYTTSSRHPINTTQTADVRLPWRAEAAARGWERDTQTRGEEGNKLSNLIMLSVFSLSSFCSLRISSLCFWLKWLKLDSESLRCELSCFIELRVSIRTRSTLVIVVPSSGEMC